MSTELPSIEVVAGVRCSLLLSMNCHSLVACLLLVADRVITTPLAVEEGLRTLDVLGVRMTPPPEVVALDTLGVRMTPLPVLVVLAVPLSSGVSSSLSSDEALLSELLPLGVSMTPLSHEEIDRRSKSLPISELA